MNICNICKKSIMSEQVFINSEEIKKLSIEVRKNLWLPYKNINNWPESWKFKKYILSSKKDYKDVPIEEWDWEYQHYICRCNLGYCYICDQFIKDIKINDDRHPWKIYHANCYEKMQKKEELFNQVTNWIIENLDEKNSTDIDPFENRWDGVTRP